MFKFKDEDFDILKIADSGQCFRINRCNDGRWLAIASDKYCYVDDNNYPEIEILCNDEDNGFWHSYFDLDTDYALIRKSADKNDAFLMAAAEYGKGIRILRQDPWEMLITFIISQRKNIPAIKSCVEKLCFKFGNEIGDGIYSFPSAEALMSKGISGLEDCSLGYRTEYVYLAAKAVCDKTINLDELKTLSDADLMEELLKLKGVGIKVANCVSLFGSHRIGAFPIDVWIDRVQKEYYQGHFPVERYAGYAGVMQQFIFYYIRSR